MVVTVVSEDERWRRGLEAGLKTRGFAPVDVSSDHAIPPHRAPLALLIDAHGEPYDAVEIASWLRFFLADRCPALVCLGQPPADCDDGLFAGISERPDDPGELLDELVRLVPAAVGMTSEIVGRGGATEEDDDAAVR